MTVYEEDSELGSGPEADAAPAIVHASLFCLSLSVPVLAPATSSCIRL